MREFLGYEFNYDQEPWASIIKEWAPGPISFDQLKSLIRFNNRSIEENPCGSIAPRCDLGPSKYAFGAVDAKITWSSWYLVKINNDLPLEPSSGTE